MVHYRPTSPDHVLDHPLRRGIIDMLGRSPMMSKNALRECLGCSWGTLRHHVKVLERAGLVAHGQGGDRRRYFLPGLEPAHAKAIAALRSGRALELLRMIRERPGVAQRSLTSELNMSRKMLRIYVDRLVANGLVREEQAGRRLMYHPGGAAERLLVQIVGP